LPEDFPGFVYMILNICVFRVKRGEALQHADISLSDQRQLRLKPLDRYIFLLQDFQEAQDCFAAGL
jgi:hypothetical protein